MIIKQIHAENILKYAALHLTNLPTRGLIGMSGPNESGKTSIAEIICLALFGRTFALPSQELTKCIKWGEFHGSVKLEFVNRDGHSYSVVRELDGDGNHGARLTRSDNTTPIARGAQAVSLAVSELSGWNYEQFIASLYLAQRSIGQSHSPTGTIKSLAGVELLETIALELAQDVREAQSAVSQLQIQLDDTQEQLQALGALDDRLARLQADQQIKAEETAKTEAEAARLQSTSQTLRDAASRLTDCVEPFGRVGLSASLTQWQTQSAQLDTAMREVNEMLAVQQLDGDGASTQPLRAWLADFRARLEAFGDLRDNVETYRQQQSQLLSMAPETSETPRAPSSLPEQEAVLTKKLHSCANSRIRTLAGLWLVLLIALLSGGVWGLLRFAPESQLSQWVVETLGEQVFSYLPLLSLVAGLSGILCIALLIRLLFISSRSKSQRQELTRIRTRMENVRQQLRTLDPVSDMSIPEAVTVLQQVPAPQLAAAVTAFVDGPGAPLVQANVFSESILQLQTALTTGLSHLRSSQERLETQFRDASSELESRRLVMRRLEQDISAELSRRDKIEGANQRLRALQEQLNEQQRQIAIRRMADQLLSGCHARLYARFNLELQHIVSRILPLLTEGRYQNLLVTKDAQLQLLSQTKGNFVGMDEISGGSYYQVWLAVRLALSHALISAASGGAQFLILDEPFAFFDNARTRCTLELLSHLSDDIAQVWVIAPQFDADLTFALHIHCATDSDTLIAAGE